MEATQALIEPIQVQVNIKRPKRFKAGAELSGAVNLVSVDLIETESADVDSFELRMVIETAYSETADQDGKSE